MGTRKTVTQFTTGVGPIADTDYVRETNAHPPGATQMFKTDSFETRLTTLISIALVLAFVASLVQG